ncbi:MAG TPA: ABC transporter ATP-binding protein [Chloroflexi bacterium]|nr:ABC transporter ATP-binding protein [Chloroflexota bacterium]
MGPSDGWIPLGKDPLQQPRDVPVLSVERLAVSYETRYGDVPAVRDVSFTVQRGEAYSIVGESGCGKSTVAFSIVSFLGRNGKIVDGHVLFQGRDLVGHSEEELRKLRGDRISMVYQDPMQALNPSLRIGEQLAEVLTVHRGIGQSEAEDRCIHMLEQVHMPDPANVMRRYPHQISGGQQQRVVIAMALLNDPALLIMDEPTTALDVTVEAAVLDLVAELQHKFDTAIMYISHNLGVVARVSDQVGVMYAGTMVERASVNDVYLRPSHPYTLGLMRCVPRLGMDKAASYLYPIRGRVPSPRNLPPGCIFEPRCDFARPVCRQKSPEMCEVEPEHWARCHFAAEILSGKLEPPQDAVPDLQALAERRASDETVLRVARAKTYYEAPSKQLIGGEKQYVKAVDDVSVEMKRGHTLGIVGESGCGKSTLVKTIIGLESPTGGEFEFMGMDISMPVSKRSLDLIKELQMVFQNPDATLNPSFSVGSQIGRPLRRFKAVPAHQVRDEVVRILDLMRLGENYYNRLPRQLSGGEKQRVGIARAIAGRPELVLCDEPVSALDVSVQAAVLNLLLEVQQEMGTTMAFIAHDLSVVRFFCDTIAVMYLGQIVEFGPAEAIYAPPYHPYTEALLSAVPIPDPRAAQKHIRLSGSVPSALHPPSGCRFHTRCPRRLLLPDGGQICTVEPPPWQRNTDEHRIFCHIPLDTLRQMDAVVTIQE